MLGFTKRLSVFNSCRACKLDPVGVLLPEELCVGGCCGAVPLLSEDGGGGRGGAGGGLGGPAPSVGGMSLPPSVLLSSDRGVAGGTMVPAAIPARDALA